VTHPQALLLLLDEFVRAVEPLLPVVREEQADVETERLGRLDRVDPVRPAFDDSRARVLDALDGLRQQGLDLARDGCAWVVEDEANAKLVQPRMARRREPP